MKNQFKVLALFLVLVLASCSSTSPSIVGEWQLYDLDLGMEIPADQQDMFNEMLQEMKDNTLYTFKNDGSMTMETYVMGEKDASSGTYEFDDGLLIVDMDDQIDSVQCNLSDSIMILNLEEAGTKMSMTFKKK